MLIYIAGPMSKKERNNFDSFDAAFKKLTEEGHFVISPANISRGLGTCDKNGNNIGTNSRREECMRKDIHSILMVDAIFVLPGWENSSGTKLEMHIAQDLGLKIIDYTTRTKIDYKIKTFY